MAMDERIVHLKFLVLLSGGCHGHKKHILYHVDNKIAIKVPAKGKSLQVSKCFEIIM